jgi:hypothetical protein
MVVEDTEVLGILMSDLQSLEQLPQLTEGFQELWRKHCAGH